MYRISSLIALQIMCFGVCLLASANQCREYGNTINCGNKEIYRKVGNRIFGPNGSQFVIQGNRISQVGNKTVYTKMDNRVMRNDGVSFTKQGSYIRSNKGEQYVKQGSLVSSTNKQDPIIDFFLNQP